MTQFDSVDSCKMLNYEICKIGQLERCKSGGCEWKKVFENYCWLRPSDSEVNYRESNQKKEGSIKPDKVEKPKWNVPPYDTDNFVKVKARKNLSGKRFKIFEKSNGICYLCKGRLYKSSFTIDHVIPLSKGGTNAEKNLRAVHEDCNRIKGDRIIPTETDNPLKIQVQDNWINKIKVKI